LHEDPTHLASGLNLANTLVQLDRANEAVSVYDQVLTAHPGEVRALTGKGLALVATNRVDEGVEILLQALRRNRGLAPQLSSVVRELERRGESEAAGRLRAALASGP
jgi:hypothetical protein